MTGSAFGTVAIFLEQGVPSTEEHCQGGLSVRSNEFRYAVWLTESEGTIDFLF
jgi:hypothetical protein